MVTWVYVTCFLGSYKMVNDFTLGQLDYNYITRTLTVDGGGFWQNPVRVQGSFSGSSVYTNLSTYGSVFFDKSIADNWLLLFFKSYGEIFFYDYNTSYFYHEAGEAVTYEFFIEFKITTDFEGPSEEILSVADTITFLTNSFDFISSSKFDFLQIVHISGYFFRVDLIRVNLTGSVNVFAVSFVLNNVASDTLMEGVLYDIRSSTIAPGTLESLYTRLAPQSFSNVFYP